MLPKEIQLAVEQFVVKVTVPIVYEGDDKVYPLGTGNLFKIDNRVFLVSARHVFEGIDPERVAIPEAPGGPGLSTLGSMDIHTANGSGRDIDVVVVELKDPSFADMVNSRWKFLTLENVSNSTPKPDANFLISGFPASKSVWSERGLGGSLVSTYTEMLREVPSNATEPVDKMYDLFFYHDDVAIDVNGNEIEVPNLGGISGGAFWQYEEPETLEFWSPEACLKIVGVQSAVLGNSYIRAKSWEYVRRIFDALEPPLADFQ